MADNIEPMLEKEIFHDDRYIIQRDGQALLPPERGIERHRLQLYVEEDSSKTAREIINADGLVINQRDLIVEAIIEYETNTNPKNMVGNFITPFLVDYYESNFSNDVNKYKLDPNRTIILLIIWFPKKHAHTPSGQAVIQKGKIVSDNLFKTKELLIEYSKIFDGDIII